MYHRKKELLEKLEILKQQQKDLLEMYQQSTSILRPKEEQEALRDMYYKSMINIMFSLQLVTIELISLLA